MSAPSGWIGMQSQVLYYLDIVGADRDEQGAFLIAGAPVSSFMGAGVEVVVPAETVYFVGERECNLAAGLSSTSYGLGVVVI